MATIPPKWLPHQGMKLDEIPLADFQEARQLVRSSLLVVTQAGPIRDPSHLEENWESYPPDYLLPDSGYVEVTANDLLWKWQELRAKGNVHFDGVFRTIKDGRTQVHFWNLSLNDTCNFTHNVETEFPIPLTESEALWILTAIGLNPLKEGCQTSNLGNGFGYYRFNIDRAQMETYQERMEGYRDRDPHTLTEERYEDIFDELGELEPDNQLGEVYLTFTAVAATGAAGSLLFTLIMKKILTRAAGIWSLIPDPKVIMAMEQKKWES